MSNIGGKWTKKSFVFFNSNPTELNYSFTTSSLAIIAIFRHSQVRQVNVGNIFQFIEHPTFKKADLNYYITVPLNRLVIFDFLPIQPYKLRFELNQKIESLNPLELRIYIPSMPLYPITSSSNSGASSAYSSTTATVDNAAGKKIVSANPERKSLTIYNPDSKNSIYLDVVNTVNVSNPAFIIPPGQMYVADFNWVGEVWGITKSGSITASVREFV